MKSKCGICGGLKCSVALGGQSGYCKSRKQRWSIKDVPLSEIRRPPLRHKALSLLSLEIARWNYGVVGRFFQPTFEQWELGFLRDTHPDREIAIWSRVANAFTAFLESKGRTPTSVSQEEGASLTMWFLDARQQPIEWFERFKDDDVRSRMLAMNNPVSLAEFGRLIREADGRVPDAFVDNVQDESVREDLRKLNAILDAKRKSGPAPESRVDLNDGP